MYSGVVLRKELYRTDQAVHDHIRRMFRLAVQKDLVEMLLKAEREKTTGKYLVVPLTKFKMYAETSAALERNHTVIPTMFLSKMYREKEETFYTDDPRAELLTDVRKV